MANAARYWFWCLPLTLVLIGAATAPAQTAVPAGRAEVMPLPMDPEHHTNALFLDRTGEPVYLVAGLQVLQFLEADVLFGNFTDGEEVVPWYLTPSFSQNQYFWIAQNGPLGVIRIRPDAEHPIRWEDNQGNKGYVVTF